MLARDAMPRGELLIVAGRSFPQRDDLRADPDDQGVMLRLQGDACTPIGPPREPFADAEDDRAAVSGAEMAALVDGAAHRYVAALGGPRALCAAVAGHRVCVGRAPPRLARAFRRAADCLPRG